VSTIDYLQITLDAQTTPLDAGIAKALAQLDRLDAKAAESERKKTEAEANRRREASDAAHDRRLMQSLALTKSVQTAEERHAETVNPYAKMRDRGNISQETYNRLVQKSIGETYKLEQATNRVSAAALKQAAASQNAGGSGGGLGLAAMASRFAGPAAAGFAVKRSLELAAGVETASIAFEVLTGSVKESSDMIAAMKQLDAKSPLSFVDIQLAGKTLLGYGASAESVMPTLQALGDISMGNGERFKSLALAFGQVEAAGRLTGQEVLQMVNQGFNPLQIISEKTGKSMATLRAEMADGAITVEMVRDAIKSATEAGGRFYGMTERMADTGSGAFPKMISEIEQLGVAFGNAAMPFGIALANSVKGLASIAKDGLGKTLDEMQQSDFDKKTARAAQKAADFQKSVADAVNASQAVRDNFKNTYEHVRTAEDKLNAMANASKKLGETHQEGLARVAGGDNFQDKVAEIGKQYQEMQLGEEKFARLQLENLLKNNDLSQQDKERGIEALRQLDAIAFKEKFDKEKKAAQDAAEQKAKEDEQQAKELAREAKAKDKELKKSIDPVENVGAVSAQAGSVEAYKIMLDRENDKKKADETAQRTRDAMLKVQNDQLTALKALKPLKAAR
jgi:tape measure domain-containing protein